MCDEIKICQLVGVSDGKKRSSKGLNRSYANAHGFRTRGIFTNL